MAVAAKKCLFFILSHLLEVFHLSLSPLVCKTITLPHLSRNTEGLASAGGRLLFVVKHKRVAGFWYELPSIPVCCQPTEVRHLVCAFFATWVTRSQRCNAVWIRGLLSFVFVNMIVLIHKVLGWECIVLWEGRCQLLNRPLIIANAQQQTFAAEALLCMQDQTSLVIRTNKLNQAFNCCLCICLLPFKSPCRICTHLKA